MLKRIAILMMAVVFAATGANAQYDASLSHYWETETAFNPASAGKQEKLNVVGSYQMSFVGFEHNPRTMYISGDMPLYALNNYHGVGLNLMSDQIGVFTHQRIAAQYALKKKLLGGVLSVGVQVGMLSETMDGSKLDLETSSDPAFVTSQQEGNSVDIAAGVYYTHGRWYAGASVTHVNAPLVELGETNELQVDRTYYFTGGYNIKLRNPFLSIPASVLVRSDGVAWRADATGRLVYTHDQKRLWVGASYSPGNSVTVLIGGRFQGFNVGYSYEAYTSGISLGNGSHELFVGYQVDLNLYKKGRNKHQSVRIL
ncbi:MAG: type IX secretion system membrane protein PorP/SprF [Prevotella sp.]|nr:type IX secretion system membrane protein PorP/SprF [Prevotella sp.]